MAPRDADMAGVAKKNGGNALLLSADAAEFMGTYSTGNAIAMRSGNVTTATGSGVSMPMIRREARYYVIRYVD